MEAMDVLLWVLAALLIVLGIVGTVLPVLPGPLAVFGGLLLAAYLGNFAKIGLPALIALGLLTLLTLTVDLIAAAFGAKRVGASRWAIAGAALGTTAGIFFGLPGLIIGPFAGAVIGEFSARGDLAQAGRVGIGTWVGLLFGTLAKLALVFAMLGVFVFAYLV